MVITVLDPKSLVDEDQRFFFLWFVTTLKKLVKGMIALRFVDV